MKYAIYYCYKNDAPLCFTPSSALNWWKANCVIPKSWEYYSVWKLW